MDSLAVAIRALTVQHSTKTTDAHTQDTGAADVVQAVLVARRADGDIGGGGITEVSAMMGGANNKVGGGPADMPTLSDRIRSLLSNTAMIDACVREVLLQSEIQIATDARMLACLPRWLADTHHVPIPHALTTSYATALVHACTRCTVHSVSVSTSAGAILLGAVLAEFPAHGPVIGGTLASCLSLAGDAANPTTLASNFLAMGSRLRGVRRGALKSVWRGLIDATLSRDRGDTSRGAVMLDAVVWGCLFQTEGEEAVVAELWESLRDALLATRLTTSQIVQLLAAVVFYDGPEKAAKEGDVVGMRAARIRTVYYRLIGPMITMWGKEADVQSGNDIVTKSTGAVIAFLLTAFRPVGIDTSADGARVIAFKFVSDDVDVDVDVEVVVEMVVIPLPLGDLLGGITHRFKSYRKEMRRTAALVALLHARVSGASNGDQPLRFDEFPDVVDEWLAALPGGSGSTKKDNTERPALKGRPTGLLGRVERVGGSSALRWNATVTVGLPSTIHIPPQTVHDGDRGITSQKRHTPFGLTTDAGDEGESQGRNDRSSAPSSHGGIPRFNTLMDAYRAIVGLGAKPSENERERADCIEGALRVLPTLLQQELTGGGNATHNINPSLSWMPSALTFKSTASSSLQHHHAPPPSVALQSRLSTLLSPIAPQLTVALIAAEGSYPDDVQQYLDQQRLSALSLLVAACPYITLHRLSTMLYHNNYSIHQRVLMYHSIRDAMTYLQEVPLLGGATPSSNSQQGRHAAAHTQHQASYPPIPVGEVALGIVDASDVCMPHLLARREQRAARRLAAQSLEMATATTETSSSTASAPSSMQSARHNAMARARMISAVRVEGRTRRWGYAVKGRRPATSTPHANSENQLPIYAEAFLTALLQFHDGTDRPTPTPNTPTTSHSDSAFSFMGEDDAQYCPGELLRCVITLFEGLDSPAAIIARSTANPTSSVVTQLAVRTLPFLMKAVLHPHGVVRGYAWWAARIVLYTAHKSADATQDAQGSLAILQHMQLFIRAAKEASTKETVLLARDAITQFLAGLSTSAH